MNTSLRTAVAAAAVAGAGFAGFGLTSAFAQTDDGATTTTEAPADAAAQPGQPGGCQGGPALDAMAEAIGIDVEDLRTALEDGQTPAEVAEENGVSRADLIDAIVAEITSHTQEAVDAGDLTQEEADERLADVEDHAADIADGVRPEGMRPGGPGGPPPGADTEAEDTSTDA